MLIARAMGYPGRFALQRLSRREYWVRVVVRNPEKLEKTGLYLEPATQVKEREIFTSQITRSETLKGLFDNMRISSRTMVC